MAAPISRAEDVGAARLGVLLGLDHHERTALAEHESVAVLVEWTAGARRDRRWWWTTRCASARSRRSAPPRSWSRRHRRSRRRPRRARCCRHAWAMPSEPEAHAEIGVITPALALRSSPTAAAAEFGMYICTASGDTARRPLRAQCRRRRRAFFARPMPVPIDTISRLGSTSGEPACSHTRRPSTVDILCRYDSRRSSTRVSSLSKSSSRCPPMRTGRSYCSTNGSSSMPNTALPVQQRSARSSPRRLPGQSSWRIR